MSCIARVSMCKTTIDPLFCVIIDLMHVLHERPACNSSAVNNRLYEVYTEPK